MHSYERYTSRTILQLYTFTERLSVEKRFDYMSSLRFSKVSFINVPDVMKNGRVGPRGQALGPASTRAPPSQKSRVQHHKKKDILFFVNYEFSEN